MYSDVVYTFEDMLDLFPADWCDENIKQFEPEKENISLKFPEKNGGMDIVYRIWMSWSRHDRPPRNSEISFELDLSRKGISQYADKVYARIMDDMQNEKDTITKKLQTERTYKYLLKAVEYPKFKPCFERNAIPVLSERTRSHVFDWNIDCLESKLDDVDIQG